jgi:hypothetical protein
MIVSIGIVRHAALIRYYSIVPQKAAHKNVRGQIIALHISATEDCHPVTP